MLRERLLTALVLIVPLILILYVGGYLLIALAILCFLIINFEFYSFSTRCSIANAYRFTALSALIPLGYLWHDWGGLTAALLVSVMLMLVLQLGIIEGEQNEPNFARSIPASLLGLCYTGLLGSLLVIFCSAPGAQLQIGWLLVIVMCSDTGAYFGGRILGGPKLSPRVSPNKTISGAVCGLVCAVLGSCLYITLFDIEVGLLMLSCISVLAGLLGQIGDLVQSMLKRTYGVKDSGSLLPGHGGLLDRIDALVFAAPILFFVNFGT